MEHHCSNHKILKWLWYTIKEKKNHMHEAKCCHVEFIANKATEEICSCYVADVVSIMLNKNNYTYR